VHDQMVVTQPAFNNIDRRRLAADPDGVVMAQVGSAPIAPPTPSVPERPGFGFRLVVSRKLYDAGHNVANSPSLVSLAPGAALHVHSLDLGRVGVVEGARVKVSGARTSVIMTIVADDSVVRGTAWVPWNQPGGNVGELIDATALVNDVRVESI